MDLVTAKDVVRHVGLLNPLRQFISMIFATFELIEPKISYFNELHAHSHSTCAAILRLQHLLRML